MKHIIKYLSVLLLFTSCALFQAEKTETKDLLPRETDVPAWRIKSAPVNYDSSNLDSYITSKESLELFKTYGFEVMSVCRYANYSNTEKEILIEIFRMNSRLNAFGIYSMERPDKPSGSDVCDWSYSTDTGVFAFIDNYYIRAKLPVPYKNLQKDLKPFFNTIYRNICNTGKPDDSLKPLFSLFNNNSALTLSYSIQGEPGIPVLKNIFLKDISFSGSEKTIFFAKRKSGYEASSEYSNLLKDKDYPFILSTAEKIRIAFHKINDNKITFIALYKEWIFGVIDAESLKTGEEIIYFMHNELETY
ncbi:MAG: hypothetical protein JW864_10305 [Spirochaetes bacterium]|nr:hypothetical protein [Spirochaetota bacterium]